jgi:phosphopantetheinyl transferase
MGAGRRREFASGRAYAKCALSRLGKLNVELLMGEHGAPIWPDGFTGSITHTATPMGRYVAAAVVKSGSVSRIGIDAEHIPSVKPQNWTQFLTEREVELVRHMPTPSRARAASAIWCAKEAATKAIGLSLDPAKIESHLIGAVVNLETWRLDVLDGQQTAISLVARTACISELALAVVILSAANCRNGATL